MSKPDGGPAFPVTPTGSGAYYTGASLRDWIAIELAASMCKPGSILEVTRAGTTETFKLGHPQFTGGVARLAYEMADEMMAARR